MAEGALLEVRNLCVALDGAPILADISFQLRAGSILGLVGESGCGKTTLALAILKLLAPERYRVRGQVLWRGRNLLDASERELEAVRGAGIAMIFQDPLLALNPVLRAGTQVAEVMRAHGVAPMASGVGAALRRAGLDDWQRIAAAYPHQLSGGERQRVTIAQALACRPALVIADEPFTALDAERVVALAALFRSLRDQLGTSFLLISHHPGVIAKTADAVLTMDRGRMVECCESAN